MQLSLNEREQSDVVLMALISNCINVLMFLAKCPSCSVEKVQLFESFCSTILFIQSHVKHKQWSDSLLITLDIYMLYILYTWCPSSVCVSAPITATSLPVHSGLGLNEYPLQVK